MTDRDLLRAKTTPMLRQVAEIAAEEAFSEYGKANLTLRQRKLQGLGIAISKALGWVVDDIFLVCAAACEDANAHDMAAELYALAEGS